MKTREKIVKIARQEGSVTSQEITSRLGISRQTAADHLRRLVAESVLFKRGSTRGAMYDSRKTHKAKEPAQIELVKKLTGLQEDEVFDEVAKRLRLKSHLSKNVFAIARYAFSEDVK